MRIGILGAGQLAMMLATAADQLGFKTLCFSEHSDAPAGHTARLMMGSLADKRALSAFANEVDVITLENEFIKTNTIAFLKRLKPVYPDEKALAITQDRWHEKQCFNTLSIPCANSYPIDTIEQLQQQAQALDHQCILKTRTLGYDGKGQWHLGNANDTQATINELSTAPTLNLILEKKVPFDTEVSIIATRSIDGSSVYYPLTENHHQQGILHQSTAPYVAADLQSQAQSYAQKVMEQLNYVGTIAIEFFVVGKQLIANEIAPRVHNSGHWTIEGTDHSQFDNHIRAITRQSLGQPKVTSSTTMLNIIGTFPDAIRAQPNGFLHDYKKEARPGRKLGHITLTESDQNAESIQAIKALLSSTNC